jgi:hypothetical protein
VSASTFGPYSHQHSDRVIIREVGGGALEQTAMVTG